MKWKDKLLSEFIFQLKNSENSWELTIDQIISNEGIGVHMAIFNEPYLSAILGKKKVMESRFSINRVNPFRRVYKGDIVLIKKTAENVIGFFICGNIEYWVKNGSSNFEELEKKYGQRICTSLDHHFWTVREHSKYGTLIEIQEVHLLKGFRIAKQDRTTWVVLKERYKLTIFDDLIKYNE